LKKRGERNHDDTIRRRTHVRLLSLKKKRLTRKRPCRNEWSDIAEALRELVADAAKVRHDSAMILASVLKFRPEAAD
jgi:hypothetical protein